LFIQLLRRKINEPTTDRRLHGGEEGVRIAFQ
jgi:hypothetical protein